MAEVMAFHALKVMEEEEKRKGWPSKVGPFFVASPLHFQRNLKSRFCVI